MEDRPPGEERALRGVPAELALWQTWHVAGAGRQILFALVVASVAIGVRFALDPWLGSRQPFTPAFAAVAIVAWFTNWRAGLLAAIACHLAANYFFIPPRYEFTINSEEIAGAGTYYVIAAVILFLSHNATRANSSLARTVAMLRQVDSRKTEFLAVLGHELRNPLGTLRTGLDLLKSGSLSPAETRYTHEMMERQIGQMRHLVEDLLDISRIDQGKIVLQPASVPVAAALEEAAAAARTFTEPMGQSIDVDVKPGAATIEADPARVGQVLANLLHNASKFSPRGSCIELTAQPADAGVAITVRDKGIGIPVNQLDSIFGTFVQLEPHSGGQPGLGLGLSLVRKLVELQGGSVRAHSTGSGSGSEFTVVFPRGRERPAAKPPPTPQPAPAAGPLRLMVVDDNQDAAESLAMLLELKGHAVVTANDGESALRRAEQEDLDIIFLDLGMPDMDGFEVAQRLRGQASQRRPTLIALTGWGTEEVQQRTRSAGFDRHLTKPVSAEALDQVLQTGADGGSAAN